MASQSHSDWLIPLGKHNNKAQLSLFCFPPAGAGRFFYRTWATALPERINLWSLCLPGRETRRHETFITQWDVITTQLVEALYPLCDRPYALFGHSLGALLSFEVTYQMNALFGVLPNVMIVSGHKPPHLCRDTKEHLQTDSELVDKLRRYGGTPETVLNDSEWLAIILPIFRADLQLRNNYRHKLIEKLKCPILALGGLADETVFPEELFQWSFYTQARFDLQTFQGNHMYLNEDKKRTLVIQSLVNFLG